VDKDQRVKRIKKERKGENKRKWKWISYLEER
jgi:hypothetical protein